MKQKVKITTIIEMGKRIVLLRNNKTDLLELPQGVSSAGEQPEQIAVRLAMDLFDSQREKVRLYYIVSYTDKKLDKGRSNSQLFILYKVDFDDTNNLKLSRYNIKYNSAESVDLEKYVSQTNVSEETDFILNVLSQNYDKSFISNDIAGEALSDWTLYTDGGSRGNPGKSSAAYAIFKGEEQITIGGEFLGITTNSQAEYHSLRIGLEAALARNVTRLVVKMDNLMVVNQINGTYTVKNRELWPIYAKIKDLIKHFEYLKVEHIRREFNTIADREVNRVLDEFVASDSLDV